jgi:hypothetical protein
MTGAIAPSIPLKAKASDQTAPEATSAEALLGLKR